MVLLIGLMTTLQTSVVVFLLLLFFLLYRLLNRVKSGILLLSDSDVCSNVQNGIKKWDIQYVFSVLIYSS